jgi:hypothetical protein
VPESDHSAKRPGRPLSRKPHAETAPSLRGYSVSSLAVASGLLAHAKGGRGVAGICQTQHTGIARVVLMCATHRTTSGARVLCQTEITVSVELASRFIRRGLGRRHRKHGPGAIREVPRCRHLQFWLRWVLSHLLRSREKVRDDLVLSPPNDFTDNDFALRKKLAPHLVPPLLQQNGRRQPRSLTTPAKKSMN